jgi:hypothetical protein
MTTTTELRAQISQLQAQRDRVHSELASKAQPGPDGRMQWRDDDLARWMGCSLDLVRAWIVENLNDFGVTDDCCCALLGGRQFVRLTLDPSLKSPRLADLDFVSAQIELIGNRLREVGGV